MNSILEEDMQQCIRQGFSQDTESEYYVFPPELRKFNG